MWVPVVVALGLLALFVVPALPGLASTSRPVEPGERVTAGQKLLTLHTDEPARFQRALDALEGGYEIGAASSYTPTPLVIDRVD